MTGRDVFNAINNLDDELIADAYVVEEKKTQPHLLAFRRAAVAAVVVRAVLTAVLTGKNKIPVKPANTVPTASTTQSAVTVPTTGVGRETSESQTGTPQDAAAPSTGSGSAASTAAAVPTASNAGTAPTLTQSAATIPPTAIVPNALPSASVTRNMPTAPPTESPSAESEPTDLPTASDEPSGFVAPTEPASGMAETTQDAAVTLDLAAQTKAVPSSSAQFAEESEPGNDEPQASEPQSVDTVVFRGREYVLIGSIRITAEMVGDAIGRTDDGRQVFACLTDGTLILVATENGLRAFG